MNTATLHQVGNALLAEVPREEAERLNLQSGSRIGFVSPSDVESQLAELTLLKPGWLDGEGVAYDSAHLRFLAHFFERHFSSELPLPTIFPMPDGRVEAEWQLGRWDASVEITLPSLHAEFSTLHLDSQQHNECDLDLSTPQGWVHLNRELLALSKGA